MLYVKNLPAWERLLRLSTGIAIATFGGMGFGGWTGWAGMVVGVGIALTGVFGFCPACALGGRRLAKQAQRR